MNLLAIDPSLNSTGLAWKSGEEIQTGIIKVKKLRRSSRLHWVRDKVAGYINDLEPRTVIYEDYAFGARGSSIFQIGELGGVLKTLCYERGLDVVLVPPSTLKLFAAGKGNADKKQMALAIQERWGCQFSTDDEADAYALLRLGEAYLNVRKRRAFPSKVRESMAKVEIINGKHEATG